MILFPVCASMSTSFQQLRTAKVKKFEEQKPTEDGAAPPSKYYSMNFKYATWKFERINVARGIHDVARLVNRLHLKDMAGIPQAFVIEVRCTMSYRLNSLDSKNLKI